MKIHQFWFALGVVIGAIYLVRGTIDPNVSDATTAKGLAIAIGDLVIAVYYKIGEE